MHEKDDVVAWLPPAARRSVLHWFVWSILVVLALAYPYKHSSVSASQHGMAGSKEDHTHIWDMVSTFSEGHISAGSYLYRSYPVRTSGGGHPATMERSVLRSWCVIPPFRVSCFSLAAIRFRSTIPTRQALERLSPFSRYPPKLLTISRAIVAPSYSTGAIQIPRGYVRVQTPSA
jgi:hypothetical protein